MGKWGITEKDKAKIIISHRLKKEMKKKNKKAILKSTFIIRPSASTEMKKKKEMLTLKSDSAVSLF